MGDTRFQACRVRPLPFWIPQPRTAVVVLPFAWSLPKQDQPRYAARPCWKGSWDLRGLDTSLFLDRPDAVRKQTGKKDRTCLYGESLEHSPALKPSGKVSPGPTNVGIADFLRRQGDAFSSRISAQGVLCCGFLSFHSTDSFSLVRKRKCISLVVIRTLHLSCRRRHNVRELDHSAMAKS